MTELSSAVGKILHEQKTAAAVLCSVGEESPVRIELGRGRYRVSRALDSVSALGDDVEQARVVDAKGGVLGVVSVAPAEVPRELALAPSAATSAAPTMTLGDLQQVLKLCNEHARLMVEQLLGGLKPLIDGMKQLVSVQGEAMTRITRDYQALGMERAQVARDAALAEATSVVEGSPTAMEGLVEKLAPILGPMLMQTMQGAMRPPLPPAPPPVAPGGR